MSFTEDFFEKCSSIVVAAHSFGVGDGHMEDMTDGSVLLASIAVELAADALCCQKIKLI